jgi:AraC-like DNA-binding protein
MNTNAIACHASLLPKLTVLPGLGPPRTGEQDPPPPSQSRMEGARKIERSIHYMMEHLNQPLQVAKLAETAHTSPSHFFVLFKRWVGLSPIDYFIRLRMRRACRLLAATSLSVKEVAAALGYDDPFYFSRVFKSVNGTPPTDYRLRMEGSEPSQSLGAMPEEEEDLPLARLPLAERLEDNRVGERLLERGHLHSTRRALSLR